jgi:hypothetical protein
MQLAQQFQQAVLAKNKSNQEEVIQKANEANLIITS